MGHEGHDHHEHRHGHAPGPAADHRHTAPSHVSVAVITCSDSRQHNGDEGGPLLRSLLEQAGHTVCVQQVVPDDAGPILSALEQAAAAGARAAIFTGGTGLSSRDVTVDALRGRFDKELPGFGELFRQLSFEEIGSAAFLSRATCGVVRGMLVFALPGSPGAVRLAMTRLVLPELGHAVRELSR